MQTLKVKKEEEDEEADTFLVLSTDNRPFAVSPLINNCCEINPNWSKIDLVSNLSQIYQKDAKKTSHFFYKFVKKFLSNFNNWS
jgi:CRISPR/Cas system CSM-associated protein Csm4 (group 5 of RAMP superfamily)